MTIAIRCAAIISGALLVTSCQPREQTTDAAAGSAEAPASGVQARTVQIRLDSGNAAFRTEDYESALRHYRAATEAAPGNPSTWFGVYMAHHAMGDREAADSALERAREQVPGASIMTPQIDTVRQ